MLVYVEMPFIDRLKAYHRTVLAIICAMCPDDADVVKPMVLTIFT